MRAAGWSAQPAGRTELQLAASARPAMQISPLPTEDPNQEAKQQDLSQRFRSVQMAEVQAESEMQAYLAFAPRDEHPCFQVVRIFLLRIHAFVSWSAHVDALAYSISDCACVCVYRCVGVNIGVGM